MSLNYKDILNNQLPDIYKNNNLEVNAIGNTLNRIQSDVDTLEREVNPITCESDGLEKWEKFFKLPSNTTESLESRRAKIIAELIQFVSDENVIRKDEMENILKFFAPDCTIIEDFVNYFFNAVLITYSSFNSNTVDIIKLIQKIKPSWSDFKLEMESKRSMAITSQSMNADVKFSICNQFSCGGGVF